MKKSIEFLTDYIVGIYETQGNFNNISTNPVYNILYRTINMKKKKEERESVKEYVYKKIGYDATEHFSADMNHTLTTHCYKYNTIENLKDIDKYIYKKYKAIVDSVKDTLTEEELLSEINLQEYKGKEVTVSQRYTNNNVINSLYTLYKQILSANPYLVVELREYFDSNRMFNISSMHEKDSKLLDKIYSIFLDYGGVIEDLESDILMVDGKFYTKTPFTESKDQYITNILYMCVGVVPNAPLNASERYLLDMYYNKYGNFRYMYRRSPYLYSILTKIAAELDLSFKELLATQGYNYQALTYSNVDYTSKWNNIEARVSSTESYETITLDRKVYAHLYDTDNLSNIDIINHSVKVADDKEINLRVVAYATGALKGCYVASIFTQVDYVSYRDGNTLNISSTNLIKS